MTAENSFDTRAKAAWKRLLIRFRQAGAADPHGDAAGAVGTLIEERAEMHALLSETFANTLTALLLTGDKRGEAALNAAAEVTIRTIECDDNLFIVQDILQRWQQIFEEAVHNTEPPKNPPVKPSSIKV